MPSGHKLKDLFRKKKLTPEERKQARKDHEWSKTPAVQPHLSENKSVERTYQKITRSPMRSRKA